MALPILGPVADMPGEWNKVRLLYVLAKLVAVGKLPRRLRSGAFPPPTAPKRRPVAAPVDSVDVPA